MATSPKYYTIGSIEPWDFIRDQKLNYHLGCAIKYICRAGHKDSKSEDLEKAIHYIQNELENTVYESELTGPSSPLPKSLQFSCDWDEWQTDPEMFDR